MIQSILAFYVKHLTIIHTGATISSKIKSSVAIGTSISPLAFILERLTDWYVTNQITIYIFCGAIIADWISGIWKHLKLKSFSAKLNATGLLTKISMVVLGSFLAEVMPHFFGEDNLLSNSLLTILRLSVFMYPAGSCWMNMAVITNGKFPPVGWINRINEFNKNLNIKDITDGKPSEAN